MAVGLALALAGAASFAQSAALETSGASTAAILQMVFGLALIVAILFLGAYLLRKLNGGRSFGSSGPLRVVGGLMLGARERIVLLEVNETWVIVGIVPGQIKTLHTLPKGEIPSDRDGENRFGSWLKLMTERKNDNT